MLTLTENAAKRVNTLLESKEGLEDPGLRVRIVAGGCSGMSYQLDIAPKPNADDVVYEQHGVKVFVDGKSDLYLEGVVIDFKESLMGSAFTFKNPNAAGTCGCGESFGV